MRLALPESDRRSRHGDLESGTNVAKADNRSILLLSNPFRTRSGCGRQLRDVSPKNELCEEVEERYLRTG